MLFSGAMTLGRLGGDRVVARLGAARVLTAGAGLATFGILCLLVAPVAGLALAGFVLVGLGASNIVPVLFSLAGRQGVMAPTLAIASVTTLGYAGILLGPALLGFVAHRFDLVIAFALLGALLLIIPVTARRLTAAIR